MISLRSLIAFVAISSIFNSDISWQVCAFEKGTPTSQVIQLDSANFQEAIHDPSNPLWFLKFYAPWCGHCKRMAPVLDKVAPKLTGQMAIGKIDCTVEKSLCKEFKVRGYPTLKYSIDGDLMDYSGGRDEKELAAFAKKMSGPAVHFVDTYEEAMQYAAQETLEGIAFLGYDPKSKPEAISHIQQVFQQVARKKQASAYFVWLNEDERKFPFIHKIQSSLQPRSYENKERKTAGVTTELLSAWVEAHNFPLVSEMGPSNFNRIGKSGRPLALSIVDFDKGEQKKAVKDHLLAYASSLKDEEADKYYFGVMDGRKWAKFLSQFNVVEEDNPQMVIMDVPTKKFYQNATYPNVVEFMKAVNNGDIEEMTATKPQKDGILGKIESLFLDNFPWSLIVLVLLVFGLVFLLIPSDSDDLQPPYDRISDEGGFIGESNDNHQTSSTSETKKKK